MCRTKQFKTVPMHSLKQGTLARVEWVCLSSLQIAMESLHCEAVPNTEQSSAYIDLNWWEGLWGVGLVL